MILKRFQTREQFTPYAQSLQKSADVVIGACRCFAETAQRFDGKVFNKRFIEAVNVSLHERFGDYECLHAGGTYKWPKVKCHQTWRSDNIVHFEFKIEGFGCKVGETYVSHTNDIQTCIYTEIGHDGRIDASKFDKDARQAAKYAEATQEAFYDALIRWDKYVERLKRLDEVIRKEVSEINSLFVKTRSEFFISGDIVRRHAKRF